MSRLNTVITILLVLSAVSILTLPTQAEGFKPGSLALPEIVAPMLTESPNIGENINSAGWSKTARVFGFINISDGLLAKNNTEVWLGRDDQAFYVAFICSMPKGVKPLTLKTGHDVDVWWDDSVELYLALSTATDRLDYWQFSVSAGGATSDGRGGSLEWNGNWQSCANIEDGRYTICMRIPFATLGLSSIPSTMRFSLTRTVIAPESELTSFIQASQRKYYTGLDRMGLLRLQPNLPAVSLDAQNGLNGFSQGDITLSAAALILPESKFASSILTLIGQDGKVVARDEQQQRFDSTTVIHTIKNLSDGLYKLRYTYGEPVGGAALPAYYGGGVAEKTGDTDEAEKGRTVLYEWPLQVQATVAIKPTIKLKDLGQKIIVNIDTRGKVPEFENMKFTATLQNTAGQEIAELGSIPYKKEGAVLEAGLDGLEPLTYYNLRLSLVDGKNVLAAQVAEFATPAKPDWIGIKDGVIDTVPKPWTPVVLKDRKVSVWGREYSFNQGPVPDSIISQNKELLASPCRIALNPAPAGWKLLSSYTQGNGPTTAVFEWESTGSPVVYRAQTKVEFDGVIRADITVPAGTSVDKLAFEMPYDKAKAKYIHRGPASWGGMFSVYELPGKKESYPASRATCTGAFYFLDDDTGLGWYDGMPFSWKLRDPSSAMEVIPSDKEALFRVSYIDEAKPYNIDRTFTFGLQAVPAKPMPVDEPGLRTYYSYVYGDEDPEKSPAWLSTAEYQAQDNIDMEHGTAEIWVKPDFDPNSFMGTEKFLEIAHNRHHQFLLRREPSGRGISFIADVWGAAISGKSGIDLKKDNWTHVAVSWDDAAIKLFVDGKEVANVAAGLRSHMRVFPVTIDAGGHRVFVDGLRISGNARTSFDLSNPPAPDAMTLLCDNFDNYTWVNGRKAFIPEKAGADTEGGYFSPDMSLQEGKWGKCIGPMRAPVKSMVQGLASIGMKQMQFHAQYYDRCFAGLHVQNEKAFRAGIKAAHDAGMRVLLYLSNSLSTYDPMWYTYADDWLIEPRGTPFRPPFRPDEEGYQACPKSGYYEYWLYRLGKLMDGYNADGFFLDGRMYSTCINERHGCGIRNFEGQLVPKSDIWDGRLRSWQMANLIKNRGGYWMQHDSGLRDGPTCYFCDYIWDGEQLMGSKLGEKKRLDLMPLAAVRVLMDGRKFGLPTANLAYAYQPLIPVEYCTYSFVHGTTWDPTYDRIGEALTIAPFWKAQDEFGANLQNFVGYWEKNQPAESVPDEMIKVSANVKPAAALVMIANFNEDKPRIEGKVKLNLKNLALKKPKAKDAFSGESVELENGDTLNVSIKSFRQAWYVLEDQETQ
ncbi:MAG: glycoside hydrolase domain-containing protein [Planctomycetota bacterium]